MAIAEKEPRIIMGIDPGTLVMGYGIISVHKSKVTMLEMGVLHLAKHKEHAERLQLIFARIESLIKFHKPEAVAIEAPFFGKNVQSMLKLGRAQGVAIAAAMVHGLLAVEYAPRKVKQVITGKGNATKEQVWEMLKLTLDLTEVPKYLDATDALGVALCHHYQSKIPELNAITSAKPTGKGSKKAQSWEAFINQNPGRAK